VAGLAATVAVASTGNPYEKERAKTRLYTEMAQEGDLMQSSALFGATGYSAHEYLWILCAGAVAMSAMVLPGISGSLVLIVFGVYFEVITAISHLKSLQISALLYLSVFSVGMVAGLFLFARLVNWLLSRFHDATMAFLIGLMAGSLYALWPFKEYRIMDRVEKSGDGIRIIEDAVVYTNTNILPSAWEQVWGVLISAALGAGIMALFIRFGGKKEGASAA
jgi:putative membrane protein